MVYSKKALTGLLIGVSLSVVSFQNCAQKQFAEIPPEEKLAKLSSESVFGPNSAVGEGSVNVNGTGSGSVGVNGDGSGNNMGTGGSNINTNPGGFGNNNMTGADGSVLVPGGSMGSGGSTGVGSGYVDVRVLNLDAPSNPYQFSVKYVCSDMRSDKWGNVAASSVLTVDVLAKEGNALVSKCSFSSQELRQVILEQKRIPTAMINQNCPNLPSGKYVFNIRDAARNETTSIISADYDAGYLNQAKSNAKTSFQITKDAAGVWTTSEPYVHLYTDRNPNKNSPDKKQDMIALDPKKCDSVASPLIIHMQAAKDIPEHLIFTSPAKGIDFDILGENSVDRAGNPSPHEKKRISWHRSYQYVYVVKPNAQGKVEGINEMFGDNTKGPDGTFSANGYDALAKFDGMSADGKTKVAERDGYINSKDAVYSVLRIWRDENFDGKSQPSELYTLDKFGVKTIDLNYDPNFYEMDKWGNEVKYKSVVEGKDGKLYLMFDVWFRHYTL